ncbi:chaperonin 10-like protein [Lentinula boryana]|uniref:Chaperonin 10-like protein n=1 Tax=Lentinula boryana TaxID=40481 RepID=A0ABQ8Q883_9AGAR|nr:chaperonin 10-like protein [Lentinula boryana]
MATQQSLVLESKQGPLIISQRPIPQPQAGELLVKVQAAGLNPVDWKIQARGFLVESYPAVLGSDAAGDVEQVGEGAVGWQKGDKVFFQGFYRNERATFQQYTTIPADLVAKIPSKYTYSQAASIPVSLSCAIYGLYAPKPLGLGLNPNIDSSVKQTGQAALVLGGSTSVGLYAIQLLRYMEFNPIIAYASLKHSVYLKSLGATFIVDRQEVSLADLPSAVAQASDKPLKVAFDAVGNAEAQEAGMSCLVEGGELVTVNSTTKSDRDDGKIMLAVFGTVHLPHTRAFGKVFYERLPQLIEQDVVVPVRVEDLPNGLQGIVDGLQRLKKNEVSGVKLVGHPQEQSN